MTASLVKPNDKIGILVAIAACAIFGVYPAASRAAYADGANAVFLILFTTLFRVFSLAAFCFLTNKKLFTTKETRKISITGGIWQAVSIIGIVTALAYIPGPIVLTILFTHTLMLLFFMAWRGEAKLDASSVLSTIVALTGLILVFDVWEAQPISNWIGIGLAFIGAGATLSRVYVFGRQMKTSDPAVVGAETFLVAFFFLIFLVFWKIPITPNSFEGWGWSFASGVSLAGGTFAMFYGIALLGSFKWSLFMKMEPIFTSIYSVLFLGEYLKLSQYGGIIVVIASLVMYQLVSRRQEKKR